MENTFPGNVWVGIFCIFRAVEQIDLEVGVDSFGSVPPTLIPSVAVMRSWFCQIVIGQCNLVLTQTGLRSTEVAVNGSFW